MQTAKKPLEEIDTDFYISPNHPEAATLEAPPEHLQRTWREALGSTH